MSFVFVLFMLHLLTVCALYVCLCDYVNICKLFSVLKWFGRSFHRIADAKMNDFLPYIVVLTTVCALYVCLCDYVNICMYLVLLCIFGRKLLRACAYCYAKTECTRYKTESRIKLLKWLKLFSVLKWFGRSFHRVAAANMNDILPYLVVLA
jgi:hypothetical protein